MRMNQKEFLLRTCEKFNRFLSEVNTMYAFEECKLTDEKDKVVLIFKASDENGNIAKDLKLYFDDKKKRIIYKARKQRVAASHLEEVADTDSWNRFGLITGKPIDQHYDIIAPWIFEFFKFITAFNQPITDITFDALSRQLNNVKAFKDNRFGHYRFDIGYLSPATLKEQERQEQLERERQSAEAKRVMDLGIRK